DQLLVVLGEVLAEQETVDDAVQLLRDRTLLRAGGLVHLLLERLDRREDLLAGRSDLLELTRGELAVVSDRGVADELADLLRVLGRDLRDELEEEAVHQLAGVLQRWQGLLLGPGRETAGPEVVVLVEALRLALAEEGAPAGEPLLEVGERLVAVDVDALGLGLDLVLQVVQVLSARVVVDLRDDRRREVQ